VVRGEATIVSGGRRVAFTEATVATVDGTSLARASGTYLLLERR
jgi:acyl-coenzyme A thioesterase PaaI-like protein